MDLSVCIVNLNAKKYLSKCINSLFKAIGEYSFEIIIVDNNSSDGSKSYIKSFKNVKLIVNNYNYGYTIALNQAIRKGVGENFLILNPDTILENGSIYSILKFLEQEKQIGVIGPKVIDRYGKFQASCRRGLATPFSVFSYFLGFSKLFSQNKLFTGYQLNHLSEDLEGEVEGVSGSCMVVRRKVIDKIGFFDERFFAYQEDSDFCIRAKKNGWKVYFQPNSKVLHIGGVGGSNSVPMKAIFEWHRSYYRYYFKHFSKNYSIIFNYFYVLVMLLKLIFSQFKYLLRN